MDHNPQAVFPSDLGGEPTTANGIASGALVTTMAGIVPVDGLSPGDRIITRSGMRIIDQVRAIRVPEGSDIIAVTKDALGGRPDRDLWLLPDQPLLIRDWRALALWGVTQARVAAKRLVDGEYVRWSALETATTCYQITCKTPEILYVDGLELASANAVTASA